MTIKGSIQVAFDESNSLKEEKVVFDDDAKTLDS